MNRLGILPAIVIGISFVMLGSSLVMNLMNNTWLVSPDNGAFIDLQRRAADGTIDGTLLYQNSQGTLIGAFLGSVLVIGMGFTLPFAYLLNRRIRAIGQWREAPYSVLFRQGLWAGILFALCIWLQMSRTLSFPIAMLLFAILLLVEAFIIIRQRSAETAQ